MGGEPSREMIDALTEKLDGFDAEERREALLQLKAMADHGKVDVHEPRPEVNLHCHTFFSYNAYGYSPSRFAWEAHRYGLAVAGVMDFDCLDAAEEFHSAGRLLGLKTVAGFESRVFVEEYRDEVINSPNEPGIFYLVGCGFLTTPSPGTAAARALNDMARLAQSRNLAMLRKVNDYLDEITVDYERDVLPLTPAGNATERHLLQAYDAAAGRTFEHPETLAGFWADKLGADLDDIRRLLGDPSALRNLIRSRLMKFGGVGYAPPKAGSFPPLEGVVEMTLECGAIPSACWLDGTNKGEEDPLAHFEFMKDKGIPTVTIIPDRNWNVADEAQKAVKVQNLRAAIAAAHKLEMPALVGTEMNSDGSKFVDGFDAPELEPHREVFLAGAHIAWGHTLLRMTASVGYTGPWAQEHFGDDAATRNEFFRTLGALPYPSADTMARLRQAGPESTPGEFLRTAKG